MFRWSAQQVQYIATSTTCTSILGGAVNSPVIGSRVMVEFHRTAEVRVAAGSAAPLFSNDEGLIPANLNALSLAMMLCTVTYGSAAG